MVHSFKGNISSANLFVPNSWLSFGASLVMCSDFCFGGMCQNPTTLGPHMTSTKDARKHNKHSLTHTQLPGQLRENWRQKICSHCSGHPQNKSQVNWHC